MSSKITNCYVQFHKGDREMLPTRFKEDCVSCGVNDYRYAVSPRTQKCDIAKVVVTIKSTADHFGKKRKLTHNYWKCSFFYKICSLKQL